MKIVVIEKPQAKRLKKEETKAGELYAVVDGDGTHYRCQGGFANMGSGSFTAYEIARDDACWVHLPDAELHIRKV